MTVMQEDPLLGTLVLGRFRIVRPLARGGQGVIYLARSEGAAGFAKPVVVKRVLPELVGDSQMMSMFAREARIMSQLRHPNIVGVIDFEQENDAYLLVLDYVHGYNLGRWFRFVHGMRGAFPIDLATHIVSVVLDALHYAHTLVDADGRALHLVHRDITPANVLLDTEGHIKLADFGIARTQADKTDVKSSGTMVKGSFPYLAPEIFRGTEPSAQSDIYAAGVMLYELVSGRHPFRGADVQETVQNVLELVPPPLHEVRAGVPRALSDVVGFAMAKRAKERPSSAEEFARALRACLDRDREAMTQMLAEAVAKDFFDPRLATMVHADDLKTLERAWREAPRSNRPPGRSLRPSFRPSRRPPPAAAEADVVTRIEKTPARGAERDEPRTKGRRSKSLSTPWIVAVLSGAALLAFIVAYATRPPASSRRSSAIVVEPESESAPATGAVDPPSAVEPGLATEPSSGASTAETTAPPGEPAGRTTTDAQRIDTTMARRRAALTECFRANAAEAASVGELSLRFELDAEGHVDAAKLVPASAESTTLGRCLLDVARATEFGALARPVAFRIPLRASGGR